ncbi:MAG: hypothetical protein JSV44_03895, partial [Candidatus Zixiibacteriota bacterium]
YTACGGTHCSHTGEVGTIKIVGQERLRGHLRIVFLTGRQALDDYRKKHLILTELSRKLTCHFENLGDGVARLVEQESALRRELTRLNTRLLNYELVNLKNDSPEVHGVKIVVRKSDELDMKTIKDQAIKTTEAFKSVVLFASGDRLLIAVSEDVGVKADALVKLISEKFGGRGGGGSAFAQMGGIPLENRESFLNNVVELLKDEISS